jgi:hypothetical protein
MCHHDMLIIQEDETVFTRIIAVKIDIYVLYDDLLIVIFIKSFDISNLP